MSIRFACIACGAELSAPDDAAGDSIECPACRRPTPVPRADAGSDPVPLVLAPPPKARRVRPVPPRGGRGHPRRRPPAEGNTLLAVLIVAGGLFGLLAGGGSAYLLSLGGDAARAARAEPPPAWREVTPPDGGYAASLPGPPQERSQTKDGIIGHAYVVERDLGTFEFGYGDIPAGAKMNYDAAVQGVVKKFKGRVLSSTDFRLDGQTGRAFEVAAGEPEGFVSGRFIVLDGRLYTLTVRGAGARASDPDVEKFLTSLHRAGGAKGKAP